MRLATLAEMDDALALVRAATVALSAEYRADGFNIGINQGRVAGAGASLTDAEFGAAVRRTVEALLAGLRASAPR